MEKLVQISRTRKCHCQIGSEREPPKKAHIISNTDIPIRMFVLCDVYSIPYAVCVYIFSTQKSQQTLELYP